MGLHREFGGRVPEVRVYLLVMRTVEREEHTMQGCRVELEVFGALEKPLADIRGEITRRIGHEKP